MSSLLLRRLGAELLGTAFLLATVVGSGIMADRLSGGSVGLALLANAVATGAMLFVLIVMFGTVSGAHFNPAVTLAMRLRAEMTTSTALAYVGAQIVGGIAGVWIAHMMFAEPVLMLGETARSGAGQWLAEAVATFGLVLTILAVRHRSLETVAAAVGLYITAAYWFTASTSFANPAVTMARGLSASFSGIAPGDVPAFIGAQLLGAALAVLAFHLLFAKGVDTRA